MIRSAQLGLILLTAVFLFAGQVRAATNYKAARSLGEAAADRASGLLDLQWGERKVVVLTNAGYARPCGYSTKGCLDGLAERTGATVGSSSLISLQARFDQPLWFAFYTPGSGRCAYLQVDARQAEESLSGGESGPELLSLQQTARINAGHIVSHPRDFMARAEKGLFGKNLFRVVTAANAAAVNCPDDLITAIQVHDHYCPGVTSGVLLARFVQREILSAAPEAPCFVLSLNPWCKEDALTTLLNATPGKRSYGLVYPEKEAVEFWPAPLNKASTVVFVRKGSGPWRGWLLQFDFAKAKEMFLGPESGSPVIDKLAMDLWFTDYLDQPEVFVSVLKTVELTKGMTPKDLLRPGADPVALLAAML